jgi:hypothetical protein
MLAFGVDQAVCVLPTREADSVLGNRLYSMLLESGVPPLATRHEPMEIACFGSLSCEVASWDQLADLLAVHVECDVDSPLQVLQLDLLEVTVVHTARSKGVTQEEPVFTLNIPPPSNDGPNNASVSLNGLEPRPSSSNSDATAPAPAADQEYLQAQLEPGMDPVDAFVVEISKPLPLVIARTPTPRCRAKNWLPATEDGLSHCSARVATQGNRRVSNSEIQAQNVLMRKWQITLEARLLDANNLHDYHTTYSSPLGSSHRRAIHALFTAKSPLPSVVATDVEP